MQNSEAELLQALEELRAELYSMIGSDHDPQRLQQAGDISRRLDEMVVKVTRLWQQRD